MGKEDEAALLISGKSNENASNATLAGFIGARSAIIGWYGPFSEDYRTAKDSEVLYARFALMKAFKGSDWVALRSIESFNRNVN